MINYININSVINTNININIIVMIISVIITVVIVITGNTVFEVRDLAVQVKSICTRKIWHCFYINLLGIPNR